MSAILVDARKAGAKARGNFMICRIDKFRDRFSSNDFIAIRADACCDITRLDARDFGDIDDSLVHTYSAEDWRTTAAN